MNKHTVTVDGVFTFDLQAETIHDAQSESYDLVSQWPWEQPIGASKAIEYWIDGTERHFVVLPRWDT
jgi:hypothetical protein